MWPIIGYCAMCNGGTETGPPEFNLLTHKRIPKCINVQDNKHFFIINCRNVNCKLVTQWILQ